MRQIKNWYQLLEGSGLAASDSGPGQAHGVLSLNVTWCPYYSPPYTSLNVTGALAPDPTGPYTFDGLYQGQPSFTLANAWHIWRHIGDSAWALSEIVGTYGARGWLNESAEPDASYIPYGTATGTAYATSDYPLPYGHKGVIIGPSVSRIVTPAAAWFNPTEGSIELMFRPRWNNADGIRHDFFRCQGGNNRIFELFKHTNATTILTTDSTSRGAFTFPFVAETLYHIVLNYGTNALFINKALEHTFTPGGLGLGSSTIFIGDTAALSNTALDGDLLYFIVRDKPLTQAEISAFYTFFFNQYIP